MKKILRILNRLNLGGPTFNAAYLSKYQAPEFETVLIAGKKDSSEAASDFIVENLNLKPIHIPEMRRRINFSQDRKAYQKIRQLIREYKPDIVHTHAAKSGALGRLAAYHEGVPVILHTFHGHVFHSYFNPIKTRIFLEIERYLAKKSTKIIAISPEQKRELTQDFRICSPEKMEVIPLGFDLNRFQENITEKRRLFRRDYELKDDEIAIGIIGRLVPIKNHSLFLKSLRYVLDNSNKRIRAFIIGDGENRQLIEQEARDLNISYSTEKDRIHDKPLVFTSWRKDIDVVNAGLDIVALTSLNEGTPVSLIEAQAANKPIVSTRVGGIENVVMVDTNALLSPSEDVAAFAENLLQFVENDALRQQMAEGGFAHVQKKFSYQRLVNDMNTLYDRLLIDVRN